MDLDEYQLPASAFAELWDGIKVVNAEEMYKVFNEPFWVTIRSVQEWKQLNRIRLLSPDALRARA